MAGVGDYFFELATQGDGSLSLTQEKGDQFLLELRDRVGIQEESTIRELATLALFLQTKKEDALVRALVTLGNRLHPAFQSFWDDCTRGTAAKDQERRAAAQALLGNALPLQGTASQGPVGPQLGPLQLKLREGRRTR